MKSSRQLFTPRQRAEFKALAERVIIYAELYETHGKPQYRRARTMALGRMVTIARRLHLDSMNRG